MVGPDATVREARRAAQVGEVHVKGGGITAHGGGDVFGGTPVLGVDQALAFILVAIDEHENLIY